MERGQVSNRMLVPDSLRSSFRHPSWNSTISEKTKNSSVSILINSTILKKLSFELFFLIMYSELLKLVDELKKTESAWRHLPTANRNRQHLKRLESQLKKLNKSKHCADIGLLDQGLFQRCYQFYSTVTEFLFMTIRDANVAENNSDDEKAEAGKSNGLRVSINNVSMDFPLQGESGKIFASLPEWIVEDMADFTLFSLQ